MPDLFRRTELGFWFWAGLIKSTRQKFRQRMISQNVGKPITVHDAAEFEKHSPKSAECLCDARAFQNLVIHSKRPEMILRIYRVP
jgi:hypothetical protein